MPKRNLIWVLAIVAAATVTMLIMRRQPPRQEPTHEPAPLRAVDRVAETIRTHYYRPVEEAELLRGAARGMAEALDEFTSYASPDRVQALRRRMDGFARGLGLEIDRFGRRTEIVSVAYDSPAYREGLPLGWQIVTVAGRPVATMTLEQVRRRLSPAVGAAVDLSVATPKGPQRVRTLTLVGADFEVESVTGLARQPTGQWIHTIDPESPTAYVRIREFVNNTAEKVQQAFRALRGAGGLVLDLRGNPGGKSDVAIQIADLFLREGRIVQMIDRRGPGRRYEAHTAGTLPEIPLVVLIDEETASGAELVAGALRTHHRAVLVGTRTRGKGCVQSMIDLGGDAGVLHLTTAEFVVGPEGPITHRPGSKTWGIEPHQRVTVPVARRQVLRRLRARAALPAEAPRPTTRETMAPTQPRHPRIVTRMLELDAQLAGAVRLLKEPKKMEAILAAARRRAREAARAATQPRGKTPGRKRKRPAPSKDSRD